MYDESQVTTVADPGDYHGHPTGRLRIDGLRREQVVTRRYVFKRKSAFTICGCSADGYGHGQLRQGDDCAHNASALRIDHSSLHDLFANLSGQGARRENNQAGEESYANTLPHI